MIIHRNLIRSNEYEKCRDLVLNKTELNSILSFKNGVFSDVTGEMTVLTFSKKDNIDLQHEVKIYAYENSIDENQTEKLISQSVFNDSIGKRFNIYLDNEKSIILKKIASNKVLLGKISYTLQGIIAGDEKKFVKNEKIDDNYKPIFRGRDIDRYSAVKPYEYIYYIEGTKVLTRSRKRENFECKEKILTQHVAGKIKAYLDESKIYYMQTINGTIVEDNNFNSRYILTILNSRLIDFYYDNTFNLGAEFTTAVAIENLDLIPIPNISLPDQQPLIALADKMLSLNSELQTKRQRFLKRLSDNFTGIKITGTLERFDDLEFKQFLAELEKQKITLSLKQQDEWEEYFSEYKTECTNIANQINTTDKEIDGMVYGLYGLTGEEIEIIEK
jgi:hypothetical protein